MARATNFKNGIGPIRRRVKTILAWQEAFPESAVLRVGLLKSSEAKHMLVVSPLGSREANTLAYAYSFYIPGMILDRRKQRASHCFVKGIGNPIFLISNSELKDLKANVYQSPLRRKGIGKH